MFRFAVMGAGNIAVRFCEAVRLTESAVVSAIASKSMERAEAFAEAQNIPKAYGSYAEMLQKEKPDCVYIAAVTSAHYELTMLCLEYGIPVLCEKAMFRSSREALAAFSKAKEKGVFLMEAMWSRFLPAVKQARDWLWAGKIGKLRFCDISIGFRAPKGDSNRYFNPALGGGAAFDLLVYAYELCTFMIPDKAAERTSTALWGPSGVDLSDHVILRWPEATATLSASLIANLDERLLMIGDRGRILLPRPHFGEEAFLYDEDGRPAAHFKDKTTKNGFTYEIEEVMRCIRLGLSQSPAVPHADTLDCAFLFDEIAESL